MAPAKASLEYIDEASDDHTGTAATWDLRYKSRD